MNQKLHIVAAVLIGVVLPWLLHRSPSKDTPS